MIALFICWICFFAFLLKANVVLSSLETQKSTIEKVVVLLTANASDDTFAFCRFEMIFDVWWRVELLYGSHVLHNVQVLDQQQSIPTNH